MKLFEDHFLRDSENFSEKLDLQNALSRTTLSVFCRLVLPFAISFDPWQPIDLLLCLAGSLGLSC